MLFIDEKYPVNAVAISECTVIKVPKSRFLSLLEEHQQPSIDVRRFIAERLYQKFIMMQNNASKHSHVRIKSILTYFKSFSDNQTPYSYEVELTRQQLAAITGLRIETVIRSVKKWRKKKYLKSKTVKFTFNLKFLLK